jgi:hypothetical protein
MPFGVPSGSPLIPRGRPSGPTPPPGPPPGPPPVSSSSSAGALVPNISKPLFYEDPAPPPGRQTRRVNLGDGVVLPEWSRELLTIWPRNDVAGTSLGKRLKKAQANFEGMFREISRANPQYALRRTAFIRQLALEWVYQIWLFTHDAPGPAVDSYTLTHAYDECSATLSSALASLDSSTMTGPLGRLVLEVQRSTPSAGERLLHFVVSMDEYYLFSDLQRIARIAFKGSTPLLTDTPIKHLAALEADAAAQGLSEDEVLDVIRLNLQRCMPMMMEVSTGVDFNSISAIRQWFQDHPFGKLTIGSLRKSRLDGRSGESLPTGDASFDVWGDRSEASGFSMGASRGGRSDDLVEALAQRLGITTPNSGPCDAASRAPPCHPPLHAGPSQPSFAPAAPSLPDSRLNTLLSALSGVLGESLATRLQRVLLDIDRIYPVLFPGKPIPPRKVLCGGAGSPEPRCAACEMVRPQVTDWVDFSAMEARAATDASLLDDKGKIKLARNQGFTHNPCRCAHLHRLVQEHVSRHPDAAWMLAESKA